MQNFLKYLLLTFIVVAGNNFYCFAANENYKILNLVENFCSMEFQGNLQGDEVRDQLITYTSDKLKKIKAETCAIYPYEIHLDCDSIFIVDSYKIKEIKQTDEKHAYAIVSYRQLARSEGWGANFRANKTRKLIKDIRDINVKLNLEYDGKRWWIIDPQYPKVSYDVMVEYYSDEVANIKSYLTGEKGMPNRKSTPEEMYNFQTAYDYEKSILNFLLNLKKGNS